MPIGPRRPCLQPGCGALVERGYCDRHRRERTQAYDRERGTAAQRGYGAKWRKARLAFLAENPLCVDCLAEGRIVAATDVDHEIPHRGDMKLFWDRKNWRGRCHSHHSRKTALEDGRWGPRG